jgi:hypothetical protein
VEYDVLLVSYQAEAGWNVQREIQEAADGVLREAVKPAPKHAI